MSLIKPSSVISAISGKLGDTVYARNRGGMYARAWAKPSGTPTGDQTDKWDIWTLCGASFAGLDSDQLKLWREYADRISAKNRLGENIRLTAQTLFTECFTNASLAGLTPLTEPHKASNRPAITDTEGILATTDGTNILDYRIGRTNAKGPGNSGCRLLIYAAPNLRPSVRNVNNQFRLIAVGNANNTITNVTTAFQDKFGTSALVGQVAHVKLRVIDKATMLGSSAVLLDSIYT